METTICTYCDRPIEERPVVYYEGEGAICRHCQAMTEEFREACREKRDDWVPANGGHEQPHAGYLYVFNPANAAGDGDGPTHGWLNLGTDIVEFEDPFAERFRRYINGQRSDHLRLAWER
jgi:hypothetical protein